MRAQQLQQQLALNAQVLTGLYEEYSKLRSERKKWNTVGDEKRKFATDTYNAGEDVIGNNLHTEADKLFEQAALFTPFIRKFKRKIASIEQIQKALKHELKCQQCLEMITAEDDDDWLERVFLAEQEGFVEPVYYLGETGSFSPNWKYKTGPDGKFYKVEE